MDWSEVDKALSEAVVPFGADAEAIFKSGKFVTPGAVLLVGCGGDVVYNKAFGCRSLLPEITPMKKDIVFDIASLTKAIVTTTLTMQAIERGKLSLDKRLTQILQTFSTIGKERMTVRHLLAHCSGYAAHKPFYRGIASASKGERSGMLWSRGAVEFIYNELYRMPLDNLPGTATCYSDLGFILLGHVLEVVYGGESLDKLATRNIFQPLGLRNLGFIDLSKTKRRGLEPVTDIIAPTSSCQNRKTILCGEVQDENAWVMGGVAPHAGVFSTAADIHLFATEMLRCWHGIGSLVPQRLVQEFWKKDTTVPGSTWALGWDTPTPGKSSSGKYFSQSAVGHLGYTGCSLWIDPERELDVVLLTNRVHPSAENESIKKFRPIIHDLVMETLGFA